MLSGRNLHKSFNGQAILNDADIDIGQGEITVLIGPSGTGKTTLLRALSMIDPPDSGTVSVEGDLYSFPNVEMKEIAPWPKVTIVFQQLFLWPHMTLRENILLPARNIANPNREAELQELIDVLHMKNFIDRYPNEASIGQRQRVALARAVMLHPQYILMDEITSALDIEQVSNILNFLPRLKERGIGILLITHSINFARRAGDHIIFMDQGKIVEQGSADILLNPRNKRLQEFLSTVEAAS